MNFAEKIVFLRKQNRFSQEKMAEDLNVSRQTISKWELGASQPTMELIVTLSKYFGVSTDYLLKDDSQLEDSDAMARVVLRFLDSVQNMEGLSKELVGIVSDGMIDDEEMSRLKDISKTLESIQRTFDELQAIINSDQKKHLIQMACIVLFLGTSSQGSLADWTLPPCISLSSMRAAVIPARPVLCLKEVKGTGLMSQR